MDLCGLRTVAGFSRRQISSSSSEEVFSSESIKIFQNCTFCKFFMLEDIVEGMQSTQFPFLTFVKNMRVICLKHSTDARLRFTDRIAKSVDSWTQFCYGLMKKYLFLAVCRLLTYRHYDINDKGDQADDQNRPIFVFY